MSAKLNTIEQIIKLIEKQDFQKVLKIAETLKWDYFDPNQKNQLLRIQTIMSKNYNDDDNILLVKILQRMEDVTNATRIKGDWLLYGALVSISQRMFGRAEDFLDRAVESYSNSGIKNYLPPISLARGHIAYSLKQYENAVAFYQNVINLLNGNEYIDNKILSDACFYKLKAIIAISKSDDETRHTKFELFHNVTGTSYLDAEKGTVIESPGDESFQRRCRARLINLGAWGNSIDDHLFFL